VVNTGGGGQTKKKKKGYKADFSLGWKEGQLGEGKKGEHKTTTCTASRQKKKSNEIEG